MEEKEIDFNFKKGGEVYTILLISDGDEYSTVESLKNLIASNSYREEANKIIISIAKKNNDLIDYLNEFCESNQMRSRFLLNNKGSSTFELWFHEYA